MKNVMGIINTVNEPDQLEELTYSRCIASVPFAGRYRLIDFVLSSMVNSGISNVAVLTHAKYRSLMDHLGSGRDWDLDRKRAGLFILPPVEEMNTYRGDLHAFHGNRDYLYRSSEEYVLITRSHMVCNVDFRKLRDFHDSVGADISVLYKEMDAAEEISRCIVTDSEGRVTSLYERNAREKSNKVLMEIFFMKKSLLLDLIDTSLALGYDHLVRDGILKNMKQLNIYGYNYDGYLGVVNTIASYYKHSMNMLNPGVWEELFFQPGRIITKVKDEPPTRYRASAKTTNSLIANGCIIDGTVENSILFRGVRVHPGAVVKNSIIMQNGIIHSHAHLNHAILDKDVVINEERTIMGHQVAPFMAGKRLTI